MLEEPQEKPLLEERLRDERLFMEPFRDARKLLLLPRPPSLTSAPRSFRHSPGLFLVRTRADISIYPTPGTIALIQDKFLQKTHFAYGVHEARAHPLFPSGALGLMGPRFRCITASCRAKGVATSPFCEAQDARAVARAAAEYGYPVMVKSRRLAYDGRGNAVVRTQDGRCPHPAPLAPPVHLRPCLPP